LKISPALQITNMVMKKENKNIKAHLINILTRALERETTAFNYYSKYASKTEVKEAKILFTKLAEEERNHRRLIKREIGRIEQLIKAAADNEAFSSRRVAFSITDEIPFKDLPAIEGFDAAAASLPLEFISGDLLDVNTVPDSDVLTVLLCDVMGHGVSPSLIGAEIRKALGAYMEEMPDSDFQFETDALISFMNKKAVDLCKNMCKFITAVYAIISPSQLKLTYTSAGHDTPIIIKNDKQCLNLKKTDLVLGAEIDAEYSSTSIDIARGDIIAVYSDGITEVVSEKSQDLMFQRELLVKTIRSFAHLPARGIIEKVFESLKSFSGKNKFFDDMSIAVIKVEE